MPHCCSHVLHHHGCHLWWHNGVDSGCHGCRECWYYCNCAAATRVREDHVRETAANLAREREADHLQRAVRDAEAHLLAAEARLATARTAVTAARAAVTAARAAAAPSSAPSSGQTCGELPPHGKTRK